MSGEQPEAPRFFYVSMIRGKRVAILAGPLTTHDEALGYVESARKLASKIDPWTDFDLFGTCSRPVADITGALNARLGLPGREAA
jgi:hypothetical protein